jgi:hypothetical protein
MPSGTLVLHAVFVWSSKPLFATTLVGVGAAGVDDETGVEEMTGVDDSDGMTMVLTGSEGAVLDGVTDATKDAVEVLTSELMREQGLADERTAEMATSHNARCMFLCLFKKNRERPDTKA